ncbi:MAG: flagellar biosynthesis protein FlhB [Planctomycetaceae bacterium]|nr:flagellar biosynthesis protein FlhB [Planctomycetaceae bacterium]
MATDDSGDKTEDPTERRRSQAREQGNVAKSTDLNAAALMLMTAVVIYWYAFPLCQFIMDYMRANLSTAVTSRSDEGALLQRLPQTVELVSGELIPILLMMFATAVGINIMQVGFLFSPEALQPKLSRLNPLEGAKRILSIRAIAKLGTSLGKLIVLILIASYAIWIAIPKFGALSLLGVENTQALTTVKDETAMLAFQLSLALIIIAGLDFAFQKWKHEQDLKMSKQEVREEMKQMEGDPHIRARRREIHRRLATARELSQVPQADVVITNPTHVAVALKYDPLTMPAPVVVAKGMGEIALKIREIAAQHKIPIIERPPLARSLYKSVKTGQPIPPDMYEVFVEIMAYVYRLTGKKLPESHA